MHEESCKRFIWASYLYEEDLGSPLTDDDFVILSNILLRSYKELPEWFKKRVSEDDLWATTGSSLVGKFTDEDKQEAIIWKKRVERGDFT